MLNSGSGANSCACSILLLELAWVIVLCRYLLALVVAAVLHFWYLAMILLLYS